MWKFPKETEGALSVYLHVYLSLWESYEESLLYTKCALNFRKAG